MDASVVGLGTGLLHVRDDMNFTHDGAPDSIILQPIAIASKSLSGAE